MNERPLIIIALAERARNLGAAPDYDEDSIRETLWNLVAEVIAWRDELAAE